MLAIYISKRFVIEVHHYSDRSYSIFYMSLFALLSSPCPTVAPKAAPAPPPIAAPGTRPTIPPIVAPITLSSPPTFNLRFLFAKRLVFFR